MTWSSPRHPVLHMRSHVSDYFQISEANPAYDKYNVGLRIKPKYCVEDTLVSITHMASIIICLPFRR